MVTFNTNLVPEILGTREQININERSVIPSDVVSCMKDALTHVETSISESKLKEKKLKLKLKVIKRRILIINNTSRLTLTTLAIFNILRVLKTIKTDIEPSVNYKSDFLMPVNVAAIILSVGTLKYRDQLDVEVARVENSIQSLNRRFRNERISD